MKLLWAALLVAALAPAAIAEQTVHLKMTAMRGSVEGVDPKVFDKGLADIRDAVRDLPYDTYHKVVASETRAPFQKETRFKIDKRYTLCVTPESEDEHHSVRMQLRIEERVPDKPDKTVNAIKTTITIVPGHKIKFHGLDMDPGKLVVVLAILD